MPIRGVNQVATQALNQARAQTGASASGSGIISINHPQVMTEVNRLRAIASEMNTLHTNAQNALRDMGSFWEGAAANEFSAANERWRAELRSIEHEIADLATLIQRVADEIREAEQRAKAAIIGF